MPASPDSVLTERSRAASQPGTDVQTSRPFWRGSLLWVIFFTLILGALEDVYGNTDSGDVYGSDAVQYLDIARAFARHDWHSVLNPLWSQGYPALLAVVHLLLANTPSGDWWTTRITNLVVFGLSCAAFLYLLSNLLPPPSKPSAAYRRRMATCLLLFAAAQTCLGQVSRVNPDELVTAFFFAAAAQLLRMYRAAHPGFRLPWRPALLFGLTLSMGFLVKAVFSGLGLAFLATAAVILLRRRARLTSLLPAVAVFAAILGTYGLLLSHAVGYRTLGDAGAINYAWHVNRLQKWVHWEGGRQPASEAWPKPAVARFAQWDTRPPDLGAPVHPSVVLQESPRIYGFSAPFHATYAPYFDPPFFYQGYRHLFRIRYQLIAFVKSLGDLLQVFLRHPLVWAYLFTLVVLLRTAPARRGFVHFLRERWPVLACSLIGLLLYTPVHLEGRYLTGMLLVFGVCSLLAATDTPQMSPGPNRAAAAILVLGFAAELAFYQGPVWRNLLRGKSPQANVEWQMGQAVLAQHLASDAQVGVISWTPSLHSDWAYIAHLQITSEIASGPDYDQFWHLPADRQAATLATFRRAGAFAVFVNGKPPGLGGPAWRQLNGTPLWMARLR